MNTLEIVSFTCNLCNKMSTPAEGINTIGNHDLDDAILEMDMTSFRDSKSIILYCPDCKSELYRCTLK